MASIRKRTWTTPRGEEHTAWVVDYVDQHGKRHIKTFKRKKDADDWRTDAETEIKSGTHTAASTSITLSEACERWLRHGEFTKKLERSTIRQRRQHIDLHILPRFENQKLTALTTPMVNGYIDWLVENGRSQAMVSKILTSLKSILKFAQGRGLISHNVAREVEFEVPSRHKKRVKIPPKSDIKKLVEDVEGRWRPVIITAIFTGLRASEIRGLNWTNVDLETGTIEVCQRADRWNKIGSPKSKAAHRTIPLAPIVVNTLREWRLVCPKRDTGDKDADGNPIRVLDLVYPNGIGNVEALANIYRRGFVPLMWECGLTDEGGKPSFSFHTLRHVAASLFIEQGWQPKRVQTVMGHATIAMTYDTYGHLFKDADDDAKSMRQIQARLLG